MTTSRDSDRLVRAWLDLMPSEAPDRVIDAVLQAVETVPQARPPLGAALRRPFQMTRFAMAALALAIVVVLAGGAMMLTRFNGPQIGASSPSVEASLHPSTPAVTAGPSIAAGHPLPAALEGVWLGAHRTVPGLPDVSGTALHIGPDSIALTPSSGGNVKLLAVNASSNGSTISVSTGSGPVCQADRTGEYTYVLSASGQTLTIGGADGCPQRAAWLGGTWWLSDCHTQDQEPCLGLLDPGDYGSEYFASVGAHGAPWVAHQGALSFTVPTGWASDADWPTAFSLAPAADFAATPLHGSPARDITVYSHVVPESQAVPCSGQAEASGELGAAPYVAWLRTVPGLTVGPTSTISIGGHRGVQVDITVATPPTKLCGGTDAVIEYLLSTGWFASNATGSTGIQTHAIGAGNHDRLVLLDMPSGSLTAIVISTNDGAAFDAFAQQAMPIVSSFRFSDAFPTP